MQLCGFEAGLDPPLFFLKTMISFIGNEAQTVSLGGQAYIRVVLPQQQPILRS